MEESPLAQLRKHSFCFVPRPAGLSRGQALETLLESMVSGFDATTCTTSRPYLGVNVVPGLKSSIWVYRRNGGVNSAGDDADANSKLWPPVESSAKLNTAACVTVIDELGDLANQTVSQIFAELDCKNRAQLQNEFLGKRPTGEVQAALPQCPLFTAPAHARSHGLQDELSPSTLALLQYEAREVNGEDETPCGTHTDYTLLTLIPEHAEPGLQVLDMEDFSFKDVHEVAPAYPEGWVLCLAGELLGEICGVMPTQHRVTAKFPKVRTSCAYFHYPHHLARLQSGRTVDSFLQSQYLPSVNYNVSSDGQQR